MSEERYLTFALGKGRLANKTMELLEKIGITCEEMKDKSSRKLIFVMPIPCSPETAPPIFFAISITLRTASSAFSIMCGSLELTGIFT